MSNRAFSLIETILSIFLFTMTIILLSPIIYFSINNLNNTYIKYDMDYMASNLIENIISYVETNVDREFYGNSMEELLDTGLGKEHYFKVNNYIYSLKISKEKNIEGLDNYIGEVYYEKIDYRSKLSIQVQEK